MGSGLTFQQNDLRVELNPDLWDRKGDRKTR